MRASLVRHWFACFVACLLLLGSRDARADLSDAIYSDAKDVIEQLITADVAHEVAPGLACLSGQQDTTATDDHTILIKSDKQDDTGRRVHLLATTHFPKTLQHIYNQQFGTLRGTLRDESVNLAAYLVQQALAATVVWPAPGKAVPDASAVLQGRADDTTTTLIYKAGTDCSPEADDKAQCRGATSEKSSSIKFGGIGSDQFTQCKTDLKAQLRDGLWGQVSSYPLDEVCQAAGRETLECDLAMAVRGGLLGQASVAQENLVKAVALVVRRLAAEVYPAGTGESLDTLQRQVLFLLRQALAGDAWEAKPLEDRIVAIASALESVHLKGDTLAQLVAAVSHGDAKAVADALAAAVAADPHFQPLAEADQKALLARLSQVLGLVQQLQPLQAAWRSAIDVDSGKLSVQAFVRTLVASHGPLGTLCASSKNSACQVINVLSALSAPGAKVPGEGSVGFLLAKIKPVLAYASRGDYADAAQFALQSVFQRFDKNNKAEHNVYVRFAESFASYLLDAGTDEKPSEAARVALRAAAVDMIQHIGHGKGFRRSTWADPSSIILPDLSLRIAWSPSYLNIHDSSSRTVASANWLTFRGKLYGTEASYVGLEVALVDLLAPFSELAVRKTDGIVYDKGERVFQNFVNPRLDVLAGSPALSEHLVVAAGCSLRLVAPTLDPAGTVRNGGTTTYRYTDFWHAKDKHEDSLFLRFIEFGFAVKYVI